MGLRIYTETKMAHGGTRRLLQVAMRVQDLETAWTIVEAFSKGNPTKTIVAFCN